MTYRIHPRDYMLRARQRLNEHAPESIFYAALELRSGIEARMQQYLETQDHISSKMKKGWQIVKLAENIEKTFRTGDKIVEYAILDQNTQSILQLFYYTPVSAKLQKMGGLLGKYLHAMKVYHHEDDSWWNRTRDFLERVYVELRNANVGTLLGVPLINKETGKVSLYVEPAEGDSTSFLISKIGRPGNTITIRVNYLDEMPKA